MSQAKTRLQRPARTSRRDLSVTSSGDDDAPAALTPLPGETGGLTDFRPDERTAADVTSKVTGRTWPDIAHRFAENEGYLYLALFLIVALGFGTTGHATSRYDAVAIGSITLVGWILLRLIQKGRLS